MDEPINYNDRKRKKITIVDKKRFVLSLLLTISLLFNAGLTLKNASKAITDAKSYNTEVDNYGDVVDRNKKRTNDAKNYFLDKYEGYPKFYSKYYI